MHISCTLLYKWIIEYIDYILLSMYILTIMLKKKKKIHGTSLAVQWLRLCAPNAGGTGSIPGRGTKIPHAAWCSQNKNNIEKKAF